MQDKSQKLVGYIAQNRPAKLAKLG